MGLGDKDYSQQFNVFYRLNRGEEYVQSIAYRLRIKPMATGTYPSVQCEFADANGLSLGNVPERGADLKLEPWKFVAAGQLLTIEMSGVDKASQVVRFIVRDAKAVTADEVKKGVTELLEKNHLRVLQLNESFTLSARVSFNGGEHFFGFMPYSLRLRQ
ncbi:hypothetical protein D3C81_1638800 [compost metagenome]